MKRRLATLVTSVLLAASAAVIGAAPANAADCGTTIHPASPDGGSMVLTYRNCGPDPLFFAPFHRTSAGAVTYPNNCAVIEVQQERSWMFSSTVPGAEYGTAICGGGPVYGPIINPRPPDWECRTHLVWYLEVVEQTYPNCTASSQQVAVGVMTYGQLTVLPQTTVWVPPNMAAFWVIYVFINHEWIWPNGRFETVFVSDTTLPTVNRQP